MTPAQALDRIKQLFVDAAVPVEALQEAPAAPPVEAFNTYGLKDGSSVMIDKLEVGGKVMVQGPDNQPVQAPAGQYVMETSQVVTVDETGTISAIDMAEEVEDEEMKKLKEMMAVQAEMINGLTEKFMASEAKAAAMEAKVHGLKDILEAYLSAPAADPIAPEKFHTNRDERIAKFLEFTKNIK